MPGFKDELPFSVEEWNSSTGAYVRDIARGANLKVARAAFRAAAAEYPKLHIKLRNRASCWMSASQREAEQNLEPT